MARYITRADAAAVLGVSLRTFRRLERDGAIASRERAHGCAWYSASEVSDLRALREHRRPTTDGDVAAQVYRLAARGMKCNDIVIAAKQPPDLVRELFAAYHEGDGLVVLRPHHLAAMRPALGDVRSGDEIAARVDDLARRAHRRDDAPPV